MKSEHSKIILAVVLLGVAVGLFFYFNYDSGPLANSLQLVCVETGEVFSISRSEMPSVIPAENEKTGRRTLLPVREEEGKLYAYDRYVGAILDNPELAPLNKYIDPQTYEVLDSPL